MITKQQVECLIEMLIPDNDLCSLGTGRCDVCRLQSVTIGTVLDRIYALDPQILACRVNNNYAQSNSRAVYPNVSSRLIKLWSPHKFSSTLQEIAEDTKPIGSAILEYLLHLFPENNE